MQRDGAEIWEIKAYGTGAIRTTSEHPFLVRRRAQRWNNDHRTDERYFSEPEWVEASNLDRDCFLAQPMDTIQHETVMRCAFYRLIGRYLGDGWLVHNKRKSDVPRGRRGSRVNSFTYKVVMCCAHKEEEDLAALIEEAGYHACRTRERTVTKFHISSKALVEYLSQFGRYAHGKMLPEWVFHLTQDKKKALLDGYLEADGWFNEKKEHCQASSVSKQLIYGMARLARQCFNTPVSIYEEKRSDTCVIEGRVVKQRPLYVLRFNIPKHKRRSEAIIDGGYTWVPVRSVRKTNRRSTVYNISVWQDESYVVEGHIATHNCQDISLAGTGGGLQGARSGLWWSMLRCIGILRPRYVCVENVPALVYRGMPAILGALSSFGYHAEWDIVSAAAFGAGHLRERLFVVAYHDEVGWPAGHRDALQSKQPWARTGAAGAYADAHGSGQPQRTGSMGEVGRRPVDAPQEAPAHAGQAGRPRPDEQPRRPGPVDTHRATTDADDERRPHEREPVDAPRQAGGQDAQRGLERPDQPAVGDLVHGVSGVLARSLDLLTPTSHWPLCEPRSIPGRTRMIEALGNAVLPVVAEYIAHQILQRERDLCRTS